MRRPTPGVVVFGVFLLGMVTGTVWGQEHDGGAPEPAEMDLPAFHRPAVSEPRSPALAQRLRRPRRRQPEKKAPEPGEPQGRTQPEEAPLPAVQTPREAPLGFAGRLLSQPRARQTSPEFMPIEDRWRLGFPSWQRYERRFEAPYVEGNWWDPYNQNVLKGDYPILGQHTFLSVSAVSDTLVEGRRIPNPSNVSAADPGSEEFFGSGDQLFLNQNFIFSVELFHGDTAFKPRDWELRITPVFNINYLNANETGVVDIDVRDGTTRTDGHIGIQELFVEYHLADLSPYYDFLSLRGGVQGFVSDFRGFIFNDNTLAFRLFGNAQSNRNQWNALYLRPLEKDTNSGLNRVFETRGQHLMIANYYRQDFIWFGYNTQLSFHYNHDNGGIHFDENGFLVRPASIGVVKPHVLDVVYLGWTGDGHIGRLNINHAFYQAFGRDGLNPIAGEDLEINAQMAAVELSVDLDWLRPKLSFFWASGDSDPTDRRGRGFDSIFDNPRFAGAGFSYWLRQGIPLTGTSVELVGRNSLLPNLRSNKTEGQANFVNPGLFLLNVGSDVELTPKVRALLNLNFLRFHHTDPLELALFQPNIGHDIGLDYSLGVQYRPFLNENVIVTAGVSALTTGDGFKDVFTAETVEFGPEGLEIKKNDPFDTLYSVFGAVTFTY